MVNGTIKTTVRAGWREPKREGLTCTFLNRDGSSVETLCIGNRFVDLPRSIQVTIDQIPADSEYAQYSKYFVEFADKEAKLHNSRYFRTLKELSYRGVLRSEKELEKIQKARNSASQQLNAE